MSKIDVVAHEAEVIDDATELTGVAFFLRHQPSAESRANSVTVARIAGRMLARLPGCRNCVSSNPCKQCQEKIDKANLVADAAPAMLTALELIESVYRQNCVAEGEPSSVLAELQRVIALATGNQS